MSDLALLETLHQIRDALQRITHRFKVVKSVDYFLDSEEGLEKMDALCMQLLAIGESLKHVDKLTNKQLLAQYPQINWKDAKGMRDIISHHYFDLDAEAIFDVCNHNIQPMLHTIETMILSLNK